ncbi:MAG: hypothetical protein UHU21_04345, partial [Lachnospiraceae bacterium]|nr:hypothetical protein [Lachnospiraceae bacterium]
LQRQCIKCKGKSVGTKKSKEAGSCDGSCRLLFLCPGPVYVSLGLAADTEPAGYLSYRQDAAIIS